MSAPGKGRSMGRARGRAKPPSDVPPAGPGQATGPPGAAHQQMKSDTGSSGSGSGVQELAKGVAGLALHGSAGGDVVGRGAVRGRRTATEICTLRTKPENVNSKVGKAGRPVKLTANYFKLETMPNWCLYQYRVDFSPEEDRTMVRKGLLRHHKDLLGGYIFDGTVLFTSTRIATEPTELFSKRTTDDVNVRISIRLVGDLAEGDSHYLQVFNILMRMSLGHLNLQLVGRNFFDALAKVEVREYKLELWPGYLTSIRQHENSVLMCAEITHKVMRQDTALEALNLCVQRNSRDYKETFKALMIGAVVLTDYNNHTYRVDDVDFEVTPESKFSKSSGEQISYMEYYKTKYGLRISQLKQPMLISRTTPRERRAGQTELVYLVPELCRCTGLTDEMRANFQLMRAVANFTRVGPSQRIEKLMNFNRRLANTKEVDELFKQWNMSLSKNLVTFDGRILPEESIMSGNAAKYPAGPQTDWTRDLRSHAMLTTGDLKQWAVIVPNRVARDASSFAQSLQKAGQGMRMQIGVPFVHEIQDDRAGTYVEALEQLISAKNPQLIMCVVPNNRLDRYSAIKKKCCVDRPVPTQVMLAKNLCSKGVMSIATKVAIQMNCKVGGSPWTVDIPLNGLMVAGFDVCHDTGSKGKSYGALVCSLDKTLSRYYSAVSAHTTGEELSNDLSVNMTKALHKYREFNGGNLPQRILFYRDGVGEGQIPYVFQHEVELLKTTLTSIYGGTTWKLGFIIVTKRINTRLFMDNNNPPPGAIADDVITNPEKYDFFLVSQSVRQGTVSPTSYNIISDNLALDNDKLQRLTYKLTHMYFNWSGTVRVPAPVQYAHKLAMLVGQSLHRSPNAQLEDSLYFL